MPLQETLAFDDVLMVPKYSDIVSRSKIDISSMLGDIKLDIPIMASPMDTVCGSKMAAAISIAGGLGVIHRYNTAENQVEIVKEAISLGAKNAAAAIGVSGDYLDRARALVVSGIKILCIDVAHGDHISVKNAIRILRAEFGGSIHIMAGNVATLEGYDHLCHWGANSVRVGIGGGSICSTRLQTGHGVPTLSSIIECAHTSYDIPIIADGGIKTSGDIVKSLAAGADFVILGSLLAGTDESLGDLVTEDYNEYYKVYRGMASKEAQNDWKGTYSSFEGVSHRVPYKGSVKEILSDLVRNVRSGLSYSGARNIAELRAKATFIKQSHASQVESTTHILNNG